jgi:hypothetical protein
MGGTGTGKTHQRCGQYGPHRHTYKNRLFFSANILTASAGISGEIARTQRTSRQQSLADRVNHSAVEGRDRVGDVTLRPERWARRCRSAERSPGP